MNITRLLSLALLILMLGTSCSDEERFSIEPQPVKDLSVSYRVTGESVRDMANNPEKMYQDYSFDIQFLGKDQGKFPAAIQFTSMNMDTPEDDLYEDIFQEMLQNLVNDRFLYVLNEDGTFTYIPVDTATIRLNDADPNSPEAQLQNLTRYLKESFLNNLFSEWIAYVPKGEIKRKSKWETLSDLTLMGIANVDRKFSWKIQDINESKLTIKGESRIGSFDFDMELGGNQQAELAFEGSIVSTYVFTLDRTYYLIEAGEITIKTDGRILSRKEAPNTEKLDEALTGFAQTKITRT